MKERNEEPYYAMMNKALVWGATFFLLSLGWLMPPGNTHYFVVADAAPTQKDAASVEPRKKLYIVDMISLRTKITSNDIAVDKDVKDQSSGKALSLASGAVVVLIAWGCLVIYLSKQRSGDTISLFPSPRIVYCIVALGSVCYLYFILNIVDCLNFVACVRDFSSS